MLRLTPLLFVFLTGCPDTSEVACTDLAAASALIHVVDGDGAPFATALWAADADGNDVMAVCASADTTACTDWIVGYEVQGEITVTAQASDGCNTATASVTVDVPLDDEGCHVVEQEATLAVTDWTDLGCP